MSKLIQNQLKIKSLKIGDQIEVEIGPIAHGGHFISRHNGQVVFVRHAITGEKAVVKITSISSKLAHGDAIKILKESSNRIEPVCNYSTPDGCGGCDFQHIEISAQQKLKLEVKLKYMSGCYNSLINSHIKAKKDFMYVIKHGSFNFKLRSSKF